MRRLRSLSAKLSTTLIISFLAAQLASFLLFFKQVTMYFDKAYVTSLNLPTDADSIGIPIFGGILYGLFIGFIITVIHAIALLLLWYKQSLRQKATIMDARLKPKKPVANTLKSLTLLFTLCWIVFLCLPIPTIYEYVSPLYVVTDILAVALGVLAVVASCVVIDHITRKAISLQSIIHALRASWSADTAYDADDWSIDNPARGQCVISSLVVQEYLGGDLVRYEINEGDLHETHYANLLGGGVTVDVTASQYQQPVTMKRKPNEHEGFSSMRDKRLSDESTRLRYELLSRRVRKLLS